MSASRRTLAAAAAGLVSLLAVASAAPAAGASYRTWTGVVTKISDGDTLWVDVAGDGSGPVKIRNAGIQALEIGQCGAAPAAARLSEIVLGKKVQLSAEDPASVSSGRPLRFVDKITSTGLKDVQLKLLREGLVLWENIKDEPSRSAPYQRAMEEAAAAGRGLWDGDDCGAGPGSTAGVRMWIHYDGDGNEAHDPNAEWVRIQNTSSSDLALGGWWLRDATNNPVVRFPSGTVLRAGRHLTVHAGRGTATASRFYWGSSTPMFGNISTPTVPGDLGDGVYLFDPQGDIRSHITYPCTVTCTDPALGHLVIDTVVYDGPGNDSQHPEGEVISIAAVGTAPVELTRKVLVVGGHVLELPIGTVLQPGERLRVRSGSGTDTRLERYWHSDGALLGNSGGTALLRNSEGTLLSCRSWGSGDC